MQQVYLELEGDLEEAAAAEARPHHRGRAGDPDQVTIEAVRALREVAYFVVTDKSGRGGMPDPLVNARERLLDRHLEHRAGHRARRGPRARAPAATGPPRRRSTTPPSRAGTRSAQTAYEQALLSRDGDAGFLVWGDPAFYDSTIRILQSLQERGRLDLELDVIPGISSIQLLAARHQIVLHEVGQALHVTSGRRLREAIDAGAGQHRGDAQPGDRARRARRTGRSGGAPTSAPPSEELVAGRVGDVLPAIDEARERVRAAAGWVMDIFLLRREA